MPTKHPDPDLPALGIRQPWLELILRGIKTIEVRSQNTNIRGPIYLYASKKVSDLPAAIKATEKYKIDVENLPRGVVVGTAEIEQTTPAKPSDAAAACVPKKYLVKKNCWHLTNPVRFKQSLEVKYLPYGIWFYPWRRKAKSSR